MVVLEKNGINFAIKFGTQKLTKMLKNELCKKFEADNNCVKAFRQSNSGASGARNNGLECATGEYILFLDSDDFYNDKDALLKLKNKINSIGADAVIFGCTDWNMKTNETVVSRTGYNLELINY